MGECQLQQLKTSLSASSLGPRVVASADGISPSTKATREAQALKEPPQQLVVMVIASDSQDRKEVKPGIVGGGWGRKA